MAHCDDVLCNWNGEEQMEIGRRSHGFPSNYTSFMLGVWSCISDSSERIREGIFISSRKGKWITY